MEFLKTHYDVKLEPCSFCGRKFNPESLYRHETICEKTSRKRPVFDSSKQRSVQYTEGISNLNTSHFKPHISAKRSTQQNWR